MKVERVEPVIITDNETGATYTLEFDRDTVSRAEDNGFSLQDVGKYPSKHTICGTMRSICITAENS